VRHPGLKGANQKTIYLSTLAKVLTEMLKFSKIISSKSKSIVKEDSEYIRIFHLLK
jgi:hypothetical protein